jgi:F-type H+-transporting ATPase subunit b
MLDIDKFWLLVLTANFLGLLYILNILLYRPLLKVFHERERLTKGSLDAAKEMNSRKEEGIERMNKEISEARSKAKEAFEGLRNSGLENQKNLLMLNQSQQECFKRLGRVESEGRRHGSLADIENSLTRLSESW